MNTSGIAALAGGIATTVVALGLIGGGDGLPPSPSTPPASDHIEVLDTAVDRDRPPADDDGHEAIGLVRDPRCGDAFAIAGVAELCTHGADPAPEGYRIDGDALAAATRDGAARAAASAAPACDPHGGDANRVEVLYVRASDVPSRFADARSAIIGWAAEIDEIFDSSAAKTGGSRKVRWAVTSNCTLDVSEVVIAPHADDSFGTTVDELRARGFSRPDRKYLLFVDANVLCGVGSVYVDDTGDASNKNNGRVAQYARVDAGCWGGSVAAHELMHTLGGVQPTAPHGTESLHCTDEADLMCYAEGPAETVTQNCGGPELFDCNNDDYFSTAPRPGTYLATKWNTANSAFLFDSANPPTADLAVTVTQPAVAKAGQRFTQTVSVANLGDLEARNVALSHALDDQLMVRSVTSTARCAAPASGQTGTVSCDIGGLPAGARVTVTVHVEVKALAGDGHVAVSIAQGRHNAADKDTGNAKVASITDIDGVARTGPGSGGSGQGGGRGEQDGPLAGLPATPNFEGGTAVERVLGTASAATLTP